MSNQHTNEPWKAVYRGDEGCLDIDANGPKEWGGKVTLATNVGESNARRIVACINACAGIETRELELMNDRMSIANQIKACDSICADKDSKAERRSRFAHQRDNLLAVLINTRNALESANEMGDGPIVDTIWYSQYETLFDYMDTAIANANGGAA